MSVDLDEVRAETRLDDARFRLAAIAESSDDAIVGKDLSGVVTFWNNAAEAMFGYPADEIIGQPITRIIPMHLIGEEASILDRIRRGEESSILRRSGNARTVESFPFHSPSRRSVTTTAVSSVSPKLHGISAKFTMSTATWSVARPCFAQSSTPCRTPWWSSTSKG